MAKLIGIVSYGQLIYQLVILHHSLKEKDMQKYVSYVTSNVTNLSGWIWGRIENLKDERVPKNISIISVQNILSFVNDNNWHQAKFAEKIFFHSVLWKFHIL